MNGIIEALLIWLIVWFTDYERCNTAQIASIAAEYVPRYIDAKTALEWEILIADLESEVMSQCEPAARPEA